MIRVIKKILFLFLFLMLGIIFFIYIYFQMQKPIYSGTFEMPEIDSTVTVYFDGHGIPHIYGQNEEDIFRVLGYLHAKERLFQMDLVRRVSSGRLSEIFGNKTLETDKFFRMLGLNRRAEESAKAFMQNTDPLWKKDVLAYVAGVNEFIEKRRKRFEFLLLGIPKEPFTVKDIYLVADYMSFNFQVGFRTDPLMSRIGSHLGEKYLRDIGVIGQLAGIDTSGSIHPDSLVSLIDQQWPISPWSGSNAWAVSAERSKSGKVLFENDTHIGVQQPAAWYEAYLECPGFSFYGSFLAGFPFPAIGHNRHHAWGLTILENDDLDFFAEHVDETDTSLVLINEKWERMNFRTEIIHVKDTSDVILTCRSTSHGPICSDVMPGFSTVTRSPVSACWTFLKFPVELPLATYRMCHAQSMEEFRNALSLIPAPGLNVIYADSSDNIAWYTAAKFVRRRPGINPNLILDGSGVDDWLGYYDYDMNPRAENPSRGVVLSANYQPVPDSAEWFPGYYVPQDRTIRINQFFHSKKTFGLDDMQQMNTDVINVVSKENAQIILEKLSGTAKLESQLHERAAEILDHWNGGHELSDVAPVIYYKLLFHILHDAFADELGEKDFEAFLKTHVQKSMTHSFLQNDSSVWWDDVRTKETVENESLIIERAFDVTIKEIITQFGPDPDKWTWRKAHIFEVEHPVGKQKPFDKIFNIGPYPIRGGIETINNQSFDLNEKGIYKVNLAAALRRSIDFADPENARNISPSGQSGNFMSNYYRDQTKQYINGNVRREIMNKREIQSNYRSKMTFIRQR